MLSDIHDHSPAWVGPRVGNRATEQTMRLNLQVRLKRDLTSAEAKIADDAYARGPGMYHDKHADMPPSIYDLWSASNRTAKGAIYWVFYDAHYEDIGKDGIPVTHNGHAPAFELSVEALEPALDHGEL